MNESLRVHVSVLWFGASHWTHWYETWCEDSLGHMSRIGCCMGDTSFTNFKYKNTQDYWSNQMSLCVKQASLTSQGSH